MFKKITKEFLEENDINIAEDFNNMELERLFNDINIAEEELERLLKKEFEDEIENEK